MQTFKDILGVVVAAIGGCVLASLILAVFGMVTAAVSGDECTLFAPEPVTLFAVDDVCEPVALFAPEPLIQTVAEVKTSRAEPKSAMKAEKPGELIAAGIPVVESFGPTWCTACNHGLNLTGNGDKRTRVTWTKGDEKLFPADVQKHAAANVWPVHRYRSPGGRVHYEHGVKTLDQLSDWVKRSKAADDIQTAATKGVKDHAIPK